MLLLLLALSAHAATPVPGTRFCMDVPPNATWDPTNHAFEFGDAAIVVMELAPLTVRGETLAGGLGGGGFTTGPATPTEIAGLPGFELSVTKSSSEGPLEGFAAMVSGPAFGVQAVALQPVGAAPGREALAARVRSLNVCSEPAAPDWSMSAAPGLVESRRDTNGAWWTAPDGANLQLIFMPPGALPGVRGSLAPGMEVPGTGLRLESLGPERIVGAWTVQDLVLSGLRGAVAWRAVDEQRVAVVLVLAPAASWSTLQPGVEASLISFALNGR